jgi:hypothetical protein
MRSRIHQSSIQAWEKPHVGFFKCNVNAAIFVDIIAMGTSSVVRVLDNQMSVYSCNG